jgi:hypothetical protein
MLTNRSSQPVIAPDKPWEEKATLVAVALIPDEENDELLLYYFARFSDDPLKNMLCLARSQDGHAWSKPDLGDGTNIVMRSSGNQCGWGEFMPTTVLRDERETNPAQRWKMVYWDRPDPSMPAGICLAASADGLEWKPSLERPIITNANDAMSMIDAIPEVQTPFGGGAYFIYQQTWKYNPDLPTKRDNLTSMHRRTSIWTSHNFADGWVGPITILEPDEADAPDIQFYLLVPFKTDGGTYGGLLNCHHTSDQTMDVQLVSSRDGWTWSRENDREPILGLGKQGQFDCGMVSVIARPVRWKGKVLLCYRGRATVHDGKPRYQDQPLPGIAQGIGLAEFSNGPEWFGD